MEQPSRRIVPERYSQALEAALAFIHESFAPTGIVVSGTIVRGKPDPASDLDIVVVHDAPWRQRLQRVFDSVPAEIFVNPLGRIRLAFEEEAPQGRPIMAHMLATGVLVMDRDRRTRRLQTEARESIEHGPTVSAADITAWRYGIATIFEDATDLIGRDPERASAMAVDAIIGAARLAFIQAGQWLPREQDLLSDLEVLDPRLGDRVRAALRIASPALRIERARPIIEEVAASPGFFEWESTPEPVDT